MATKKKNGETEENDQTSSVERTENTTEQETITKKANSFKSNENSENSDNDASRNTIQNSSNTVKSDSLTTRVPLIDETRGWQINRFGEVSHSPESAFLSIFYKQFHDTRVDIPVSLVNTLLVFDFQTQVERLEGLEKLSAETIDAMVTMVASVLKDYDEASMIELLQAKGVDLDEEQMVAVLKSLRKKMTDSVARSGLTGMMFKDSLSKPEILARFTNSELPELQELSSSILLVQELYAKFALSASAGEVAAMMTTKMFETQPLMIIRGLYKIFNGGTIAPSAPGKLSYVMDQLLKGFKEEPLVSYDDSLQIPGFRSHVSDVPAVPTGLSYADVMGGFFYGLRTVMGFAPELATTSTISVSDMIESLTTGIGEVQPFMPEEAGQIDPERLSKFFSRMWFLFVLKRICTNDLGQTAGRIDRIKNVRKYDREDEFEMIIKEGIACASIMYDSFIDATAFMRAFAENPMIRFEGIHPVLKSKLTSFLNTLTDRIGSANLSIDHTNYLVSAKHVLLVKMKIDGNVVGFIPKDSMYKGKKHTLMDPSAMTIREYCVNDIISGSIVDMGLEGYHPRFLSTIAQQNKMDVLYSTMSPNNVLLSKYDILRTGISIFQLDKIKKEKRFRNITEFIINNSRIFDIMDEIDFIDTFGVPLEISKMLYNGPGVYLKLNISDVSMITWDRDTAPVYETKLMSNDLYSIRPVVTHYPFLMHRTTELPYLAYQSFTMDLVNIEKDVNRSVEVKISDKNLTDNFDYSEDTE